MDVCKWALIVVAFLTSAACADPVTMPDAGADAGPDAEVVDATAPDDAGPGPVDAGSLPDASPGRRSVSARGLAPVLGVSSGARREVRGRVSPIVGTGAGVRRVVRTLPTLQRGE